MALSFSLGEQNCEKDDKLVVIVVVSKLGTKNREYPLETRCI